MKIDSMKLRRIEEKSKQAHAILMDVSDRFREAKKSLDTHTRVVRDGILRGTNGHSIWAEIEANWPNVNLAIMGPVLGPDYSGKQSDQYRWEHSVVFSELQKLDEMKAEVARLQKENDAAQQHWHGRNACLRGLQEFADKAQKTGGLNQ